MNLEQRRPLRPLVAVWLLSAAGVIGSGALSQPQELPARPLVIYLEDGPWVVTPLERSASRYLPLTELVRQMALPYTDATAAGLFTIRGPEATLVIERETGAVTRDGEALELDPPVLNEDGRWLVPIEFLLRGLGPAAGLGFEATDSRIIAGNVEVTPLEMEAAATEGVTRLTLRLGRSSTVRVQQERDRNLVTLSIDRAPLSPVPETLDYRDNSIRSVAFDDRDGRSRIVVETTPQVVNVRLLPGDGNRTFFLEFVPAAAPAETVTAAPPPLPGAAEPDAAEAGLAGPLRVLVIDPGHGGLDSGTRTHGVLEKDLTLVVARRLQATLEARLSATVILTRQEDRALNIESRSAIANQNQADLLVSLHVGFSPDPTESRATVFLMKDSNGSAASGSPPAGDFFVPWYHAHRASRDASMRFGQILRERLSAKIPEWPAEMREAPLGILASAAMPAVIAELGNANNPQDLARLADAAFQNRIIDAIVESVQAAGGRARPEAGN